MADHSTTLTHPELVYLTLVDAALEHVRQGNPALAEGLLVDLHERLRAVLEDKQQR